MRPDEGDPLITTGEQTKYCSGVGMLLCLIKHSRPDISNAVRELTKVLDGATPAHWKAMIRVIKYVLDTKMHALKLHPVKDSPSSAKFNLEGYSDSEFAGDRDTRVSVYGYITYFCGAPISWKSKASKSVTLSSTEAEYFASSETAKELIFITNLIKGFGEMNYLNLPLTLRVDNTGAIYLANNHSTGPEQSTLISEHIMSEI